ncbi:unnamed protein product [Ectocarpus sp. 13 AM-2016]
MLERPRRRFERDVQRGELVYVDQGAAAGVLGVLHGVQKLPDPPLVSRCTNPTQAACKGRCPTSAPRAVMPDARATATSPPRDVGHAESSGIEHPNICTNRRGLPEVWRGLRWKH